MPETASDTTTASDFARRSFRHDPARDLPPKLIADASTLVADYLGVAIAGSQTDSGAIAARFANETGGKPKRR